MDQRERGVAETGKDGGREGGRTLSNRLRRCVVNVLDPQVFDRPRGASFVFTSLCNVMHYFMFH